MWTGSEWILVGDGGGLSPQAASAIYLSIADASATYLTQASGTSIVDYIDEHVEGIYNVLFEGGANYLSSSGGQVYGDVIIDGDLTVSGSTTYLNTNQLNIEDNIITLNYGVSGSPSLPAGIEVERGDLPNTAIRWNEELDVWEFTNDGSEYNELGSGAGVVLYQSSSPDGTALGLEVGAVWIDSDADLIQEFGQTHIHGQYLSIATASSTYATKAELEAFSSESFLIKAESYTANISDVVFVNTASGLYTITLPVSTTLGDKVTILDLANNAATNNITVDPNGSKIDGASGNFIIDINNAAIEFIYSNNTYGWRTKNG